VKANETGMIPGLFGRILSRIPVASVLDALRGHRIRNRSNSQGIFHVCRCFSACG